MRLGHGFERAFNPRAVAIVGVSRSSNQQFPGYTGLRFLRMLRDSGFEGRVYPINPRAGEVDGLRVYSSVTSVPEPLDLVIVAVQAPAVPRVLEECAAAGALNVHVCSAGFGETREAEGEGLESAVREIALRGGLHLVGPNCMGIHVPSVGLRMYEGVPLIRGPVAFISQSGGHGQTFLEHCAARGVGCSKVISFGNALILEASDFLEYLAGDPETRVICMYLEGIGDGSRFTRMDGRISWAGKTRPRPGWRCERSTYLLGGGRRCNGIFQLMQRTLGAVESFLSQPRYRKAVHRFRARGSLEAGISQGLWRCA